MPHLLNAYISVVLEVIFVEWWKFRRLFFYLVDHALRQCFKPSCTKLGNRDFVCKMAERIVHYSVILLINDRSKCVIYTAAFTILSKIKSFKWAKSVILEINALYLCILKFRSIHDTLWSTKFTPDQCELASTLNSWTQNCRKSQILWLPKVSRLRACLHGGGGPQVGVVICGGLPH